MKSLFFHVVGAIFLVQPVDALAFDYSDLDVYCQELEKDELESIKKEVAQGSLTQAEADEEIAYMPEIEQCVCYFQKLIDGAGAEYTLFVQKFSLENYTVEELNQLEMPEYPEGLDIDALMENNAIACGIDTE